MTLQEAAVSSAGGGSVSSGSVSSAGGGSVSSGSVSSVDSCGVRVVDRERVAAVRAVMPAEQDIGELAQVFGLLSEPGRLRLLTSLLEAGELCVCDLAAATGMSESSVSHALRLLRASRVVSVQRRGRMAYYRLDDAHVRMLLDLGLTHTRHTSALRAAPDEALQ